MYGKVVDFIYMQIPQWDIDWYIYNLADVFITLGAIFTMLLLLFKHNHIFVEEKKATPLNISKEEGTDLPPEKEIDQTETHSG